MFKKLLLALMFLPFLNLNAQETYPVNGVHDDRPELFAFTNATIHTDHQQTLENATMVIKEGKIISVGQGANVPTGAVVYDLQGRHIYPSFIDLISGYGVPEIPKEERKPGPQYVSDTKGAYGWNEAIRSEFNSHESFTAKEKDAEELRKVGVGVVLAHRKDGIARGTGALVSLGKSPDNESIIKDKASNHLSFIKGSSSQNYPSSLMGAIALLRQTYLDAQWYSQSGKNEELNLTLQGWNDAKILPTIFSTRDRLEVLRADKIGDEFGKQYIIQGSGDEYQRINEIKGTGASLIIPVKFPEAYDVSDPFDARLVELSEMKHWEMAPANAGIIAQAGIQFAFTTDGLKKKADFMNHVKKCIKYGLSESDALKALTSNPAAMLGMSSTLGSLASGKAANFLITSGPIFDKDTKIYHNWTMGEANVLSDWNSSDLRGSFTLNITGLSQLKLNISGEQDKPTVKIKLQDSIDVKVKSIISDNMISLSFNPDKEKKSNTYRLNGVLANGAISGKGTQPNGDWLDWSARRTGDAEADDKKKDDEEEKTPEIGNMIYPFIAYGWENAPTTETVLLKNGTVWTNEQDGVLENTDVLIQNGTIANIGKNLSASGAKIIDCSGKHITCGIIDEHSHIAISKGVNEGTQASSAEVSISDVVNSEDVNIYRQLAGGVTTAQLLHGSANPIGGQAALIKFRWGSSPEEMKLKGADGFIKFALGENVKQSNWGDRNTTRFPQTRMGVEQVYMDHFTRAQEYMNKKNSNVGVRKDLELETLGEIINKQRFVTCHSYVQSEINMLMHVAERFNFNINTFTHILEGYKVADKMKAHGVGGSTFSDWWAYKYEVIDAIPYNAALMNEMGVTVAINSDDAEMGRRLNQEAGKIVKYGGASEEDAWKMVTLNPAKLLHIDDKVGSIKKGKDADVVVWSDNPLSVYAQAERTYVDGICYFDKESDKTNRDAIKAERSRLIQKMIEAKNGGAKTKKPMKKEQHLYHCDDMHDYCAE